MIGVILAKGSTHDKLNLITGAVLTGIMVGTSFQWQRTVPFAFGWLLATFVLTPDLDIGPKNRKSVVSILLYPYSVLFKHRGISHSFILGTITRIIYVYVIFIIISALLAYFSIIKDETNYLSLILAYDYQKEHYLIFTWIVIGMSLADACHIVIDYITGLKNRIF